jgi:hypothetical protein
LVRGRSLSCLLIGCDSGLGLSKFKIFIVTFRLLVVVPGRC